MIETTAQRDAQRIQDHAPMLLAALTKLLDEAWPYLTIAQKDEANDAIEYASGAHDPDCYPEAGYDTDAAGTFTG
jgi:hypothetical protein